MQYSLTDTEIEFDYTRTIGCHMQIEPLASCQKETVGSLIRILPSQSFQYQTERAVFVVAIVVVGIIVQFVQGGGIASFGIR